MAPRIGVVVFPGTNCEHDVVQAAEAAGGTGVLVWHGAARLEPVDALVLPGGFAHGDYLRPGALQKNGRLRFLCQPARVVVASTSSVLTAGATVGDELVIPINHFSGNYTCDDESLRRLQAEDRIVLRYADNPNGSVDAVAGIANEAGNVVGLMPHPERASAALLGSTDGLVLLRSLVDAASARAAA